MKIREIEREVQLVLVESAPKHRTIVINGIPVSVTTVRPTRKPKDPNACTTLGETDEDFDTKIR